MASSPDMVARIFVDVIIVGIVLISAIFGWRKGFAGVLLSCFGWLICIAGAIVGSYPLKNYLVENSAIDNAISEKLKIALLSPTSGFAFFSAAPEQMQQNIESYQQSLAGRIALTMTDRILSVFSFLVLLILLILVTKLISLAVSNKEKRGPVGIVNGFLGFIFGALRGAFIVCVVLVAVFPILSLGNVEASSPIISGIRESELASLLYDRNPILMPFDLF